MTDKEAMIFIAAMLFYALLGFIAYIWSKKDARKYMPLEYKSLMRTINEVPIAEYKYNVFHGYATGPMAGPSVKCGNPHIRTKILFFKEFLIITAENLAAKISYNTSIDFVESKSGNFIDFFGNIVIVYNSLVYNIYNIRNREDFYFMKSIVENYRNTKR